MKTKMISMVVMASLLTVTAQASSISAADCTLTGAPTGGDASTVRHVKFGAATQNAIGTEVRQAVLGSVTATLGEAPGQPVYINVQDTKNKTYFASAFEGAATYATSRYTIQIVCK